MLKTQGNQFVQSEKVIKDYSSLLKNLSESERSLLKKIIQYCLTQPPEKTGYIRSKVITRDLYEDHDNVLPIMLQLTQSGFFNISWEILCPNCRGSKDHLGHLWESPQGSKCDKCSINFIESGYGMLEIAFRINPDVRNVEEHMFCSAEPAKKPMIVMQKLIKAGESCSCTFPLSVGRYRLIRMDDLSHVNFLDILEESPESEIMWFYEDKNRTIKGRSGSEIKFFNDSKSDVYITIQRDEIDDDILRPAELFNYQDFRDLFPDERIASGLSIDIGVQNIVFVDIVGSSEKFKELGDKDAFVLVRQFYGQAHEIVHKFNGVIVKTIGDEVMCAFSRGIDALKAAFSFVKNSDKGIDNFHVRVSLNRGSCLAVNMNTGIDYFGTPVNIAAKMQKYTNQDEISFSKEFASETKVKTHLVEKGFAFKQLHTETVKGIGEIEFYKIKVKKVS
jgi:class 3 adenylate cyclase